ncbi:MAG TPA: hypothetical protein DCL44_06110 [Elusimicrobia bacterium]|nr:hypothetical protein [Elusimicrobiota bacterium]
MTDLNYILETVLLLALPLIPIVAGVMLRRKFSPASAAESAEPVPMSPGRKAGLLAGNILLWGGIMGIVFMIIVLLNFKGKL